MPLAKNFVETAAVYSAKDILGNTQLFSAVDADVLDMFCARAVQCQYQKGNILFMHEDPAECFYVIAKGWVKLFRETYDGEEAVVDVLSEGHMFGETAIFEGDAYAYGAEVVEDAVIFALPLSLLKDTITENSQLSMQMFSVMSRFRKQQDQELEHRDLQSAPQRIGCFLLRLCKADAKGPITLHLPYDKTLIASRLGMKAETFSRALARLRKETNIRVQGATVEIDTIAQLSDYSCSACSSSFPCQDMH